jgi:hypothetical protein
MTVVCYALLIRLERRPCRILSLASISALAEEAAASFLEAREPGNPVYVELHENS